MMTITEKVAYLKGLADGMKLSAETNEGKLLLAVIDTLEDMALTVSDMEDSVAELSAQVDEIDDDLGSVEEDLYGDECLRKVADHSAKIVEGLNASGNLPFEVVLKPTLISQASIRQTFNDANNEHDCAGVMTWMHTFSPA